MKAKGLGLNIVIDEFSEARCTIDVRAAPPCLGTAE